MRHVVENGVLHWPERVLSALELDRLRLDVQTIVVASGTVVTPSARDWLRDRSVAISFEAKAKQTKASWRIAEERPFDVVRSVLASLGREGLIFEKCQEKGSKSIVDWTQELMTDERRIVAFTGDPALMACVANKSAAIQAAAVTTVAQVEKALRTMAANWLAVEMPGRSFFELRQMLKLASQERERLENGNLCVSPK